jgi:hypothetical protein
MQSRTHDIDIDIDIGSAKACAPGAAARIELAA